MFGDRGIHLVKGLAFGKIRQGGGLRLVLRLLLQGSAENVVDLTPALGEDMLDAMCHLSEIEQKVITHLYLSDDPMTEHEFEKTFGVKRCTVHYYKVSALEQLREMLSENV